MASLPKSRPSTVKRKPAASPMPRLLAAPAKVVARHRGPVAAGQAKTHLLALINQVNMDRTPIVITKRGRPVAQLAPIDDLGQPDIFGCMKGTGSITGDIVGPEPDLWEAMSE